MEWIRPVTAAPCVTRPKSGNLRATSAKVACSPDQRSKIKNIASPNLARTAVCGRGGQEVLAGRRGAAMTASEGQGDEHVRYDCVIMIVEDVIY